MAAAWKTVRVFISSTFRDMRAERDHLVRFVFPRLREELLKRHLHFVDVDLRWGLKSDQDALDLCMEEIDRCHPRFVCILGGRYGWVPAPKAVQHNDFERVIAGLSPAGQLSKTDHELLNHMYMLESDKGVYRLREKPQALTDLDRWRTSCEYIVEIFQRAFMPEVGLSITASEIYYGALDKLDVPVFRYFYFRQPAVTAAIPREYAADYRELDGSFAERALAELKEKIRNARGKIIQTSVSGSKRSSLVQGGQVVGAALPVFEYPCRWDPDTARIIDLHEFGARVYSDLLESVDAEFGLATNITRNQFAEDAAAMEAFIELHTERYVVGSRQETLDALRTHAEETLGNPCLCLIGVPGSGKSSLLGELYREYVNGTSEHSPQADHIVIPHFVGASAASTDSRLMLRRFCHELSVNVAIDEPVPHDYDKLQVTFPRFLKLAAERRHVVILIDAINQLDIAHNAHSMSWLPASLPKGVRIIMTALPGPMVDTLRARSEPPVEIALPELDYGDARTIVEEFLSRYRKSLDEEQQRSLLSKDHARLPLYLLTALEELRTLGNYEEITERIDDLPGETRQLFIWILNRLESDEGFRDERGIRIGIELSRRYCSYLAIGRSGMAQSELVDLIAPAHPGTGMPGDLEGNVAAYERLLRPHLMRRDEVLDFFHEELREAVKERYLADEAQLVTANQTLATYFQRKADPTGTAIWSGDYPRAFSELPYHQTEGQMWQDVYKTLTDFGFLEAKCTCVAVSTSGNGPASRKIYEGVYELQEDYRRAIAKFSERIEEL